MDNAPRRPVVFDTDIGSDVDDALTLAMLLGSPEVDLLGVTTVYGDTRLRAQVASRLIRLAGLGHAVPCVPGARRTLTDREIWWAGHEGGAMDDLDREPLLHEDVTTFLSGCSRSVPDVSALCTGPLTNLARTLQADPGFGSRVSGLTIMGGAFAPTGDQGPEHNFACDPEAAHLVTSSNGVAMVVTGLEITRRLRLTEAHVDRIVATGPLGIALGREIEQWWRFNGERWNVPHDPVAALTLIAPDLFAFTEVDIEVSVGARPGECHAEPSPGSRTRLVTDVDEVAVSEAIVERIVRACSGPPGQA